MAEEIKDAMRTLVLVIVSILIGGLYYSGFGFIGVLLACSLFGVIWVGINCVPIAEENKK